MVHDGSTDILAVNGLSFYLSHGTHFTGYNTAIEVSVHNVPVSDLGCLQLQEEQQ